MNIRHALRGATRETRHALIIVSSAICRAPSGYHRTIGTTITPEYIINYTRAQRAIDRARQSIDMLQQRALYHIIISISRLTTYHHHIIIIIDAANICSARERDWRVFARLSRNKQHIICGYARRVRVRPEYRRAAARRIDHAQATRRRRLSRARAARRCAARTRHHFPMLY